MRKQNLKKSNAFDVYYTNLGVYEGGARFTLFVGLPLQPLHTCTTLYCTEWSADVYSSVQICANLCKCVQQQSAKLFSAVNYCALVCTLETICSFSPVWCLDQYCAAIPYKVQCIYFPTQCIDECASELKPEMQGNIWMHSANRKPRCQITKR